MAPLAAFKKLKTKSTRLEDYKISLTAKRAWIEEQEVKNSDNQSLNSTGFFLVREKAKIVVELISDEGKLEEERENAKKLREKIGGGQMQAISSDSAKGGFGGYGGSTGGFGSSTTT